MLSLPEPAVALTAVSRVHRTAAGEVGAVAGVTLRVDADDSETEAMRQAILRYQAIYRALVRE